MHAGYLRLQTQQRLHERGSILRYTYIACLVPLVLGAKLHHPRQFMELQNKNNNYDFSLYKNSLQARRLTLPSFFVRHNKMAQTYILRCTYVITCFNDTP
jgi:hypothetical protein